MSRNYTSFQRGAQATLISAFVLVVSGCATSGGDAHPREFTSGKVNTSVDANAASAVFLRPVDAVPGQAVNIFVNGEYLTSLTPGGFKQSATCVGSNRLTASYTDVSTRYLEKERQGRVIGYGGMLTESFVAIMALVAACTLDQHLYFGMNAPAGLTGAPDPASAAAYVNGLNLVGVSAPEQM